MLILFTPLFSYFLRYLSLFLPIFICFFFFQFQLLIRVHWTRFAAAAIRLRPRQYRVICTASAFAGRGVFAFCGAGRDSRRKSVPAVEGMYHFLTI